jgi:hypothetical protein
MAGDVKKKDRFSDVPKQKKLQDVSVKKENALREKMPEKHQKMKDADKISEKKDVISEIGLLQANRMIDKENNTICPLCMEKLKGMGFLSRLSQAEGRAVPDLTVTEINLFHIRELRIGEFNHKPYNLGWGHHHCNVVCKDSGIIDTLKWMKSVTDKNIAEGIVF